MIAHENSIEIPAIDIVSWAFHTTSPTIDADHTQPIWVDTADSSNYVDVKTAKEIVRKLICGLRHRGLQQGDVVCVHSFNNIWYPVLYLAIIGAGGVFIGSNPAYKPSELEHLFFASRAIFLVIEDSLVAHVLPTAVTSGIKKDKILLLDNCSPALLGRKCSTPTSIAPQSWRSLLNYGVDDWITFDDELESRNTKAVFLLSSGTTGLPKIVMMSHYAIITQLALADYQVGHISHKVRRLITLPFFHSFVLPFPILSLHRLETLYVTPRFSAEHCISTIDRYKITMMPVVPPILRAFLKASENPDGANGLSSLTEIICAGAPLDAETQQQFAKWLPPTTRLVQLWGMSETGWITAFRHPQHDPRGSVGRLLPNIKAKLIDNDGKEITQEVQVGEVWVQTPGVMMGYLSNASETGALFKGGWLKTGDIAYYEDEKWYIVDRAKDMIKVRGWSVSPTELEVCLLRHPKVADAGVIGVPDDFSGELPLAFVVSAEPGHDRPRLAVEIKGFVAQNLASYKALSDIVFVSCIPRGPSGKILRRLLRDQFTDKAK